MGKRAKEHCTMCDCIICDSKGAFSAQIGHKKSACFCSKKCYNRFKRNARATVGIDVS